MDGHRCIHDGVNWCDYSYKGATDTLRIHVKLYSSRANITYNIWAIKKANEAINDAYDIGNGTPY
jgi:hypothetical protein